MVYLIYFFDYDFSKSKANKLKHGISFVEAQALWKDPDLVESPAKYVDEPRYLIVGRISSNYWTAIVTYRLNIIRIISVRSSRKNEIENYEKNKS